MTKPVYLIYQTVKNVTKLIHIFTETPCSCNLMNMKRVKLDREQADILLEEGILYRYDCIITISKFKDVN